MYVCIMYVCMYVCVLCAYVCMYVFMYVFIHVCMHACVYVCMYVCMHVCMYYVGMHTYSRHSIIRTPIYMCHFNVKGVQINEFIWISELSDKIHYLAS